jgi:efflux transporter, RND family, MFP subunit
MKYKKWLAVSVLCAVAVTGVFTGGCGKQQAAQNAQATKVTTFRPFTSDTPIVYEYTGTVAALQEVPVRARVSGTIMEKYINGGDTVTEGQPLYRIDTRQYESALASARANQAQCGATYQNSLSDLARYDQLVAIDGISRQMYDTQKSLTEQYLAAYNAAGAQVQLAQDNLDDTIVRAPFNGKLSLDDVNIGTYATAGNTSLVTISSTDPIYITFDMSETEYLQMSRKNVNMNVWGNDLKLRLSDGSIYGSTGHIVQVSPGLTSGQLSLKAEFANPDGLLVPGMYGTIVSDTEIAANSLLIPTQALIPLLNKNMVDVVVDNKVMQKAVEVGGTYGNYTVITGGLSTDDVIIVEGQGKVTVGQPVAGEEISREKLEEQIAAATANA